MAEQPSNKPEGTPDKEVPCNGEYVKCIFFYKLNEETKDETMKELLSKYGELDYIYVARKDNGESKKLGFAKFKSQEIAEKAVEGCKNAKIDGKSIKVLMARPRTQEEIDKYGDY